MRLAQGGSTPMIDDDERAAHLDGADRRRNTAPVVRAVLVTLLVVGMVLVAFDNRHEVRLGYVFGDGDVPVWIAMTAAAVVGVVLGWLVTHRPRRR